MCKFMWMYQTKDKCISKNIISGCSKHKIKLAVDNYLVKQTKDKRIVCS